MRLSLSRSPRVAGLLLLVMLLVPLGAYALKVPFLKGRVNDYAQMLSPAAVQHLDRVLQDLETSDSTQIVVLTIPSLEGDSLVIALGPSTMAYCGDQLLDQQYLELLSNVDGYGIEDGQLVLKLQADAGRMIFSK